MWQFLPKVEQRRAVEVAEAFADEQCGPAELAQAKDSAWGAWCELAGQHIAEGRPQDQEKIHVQLAAHAVGWVAHKQARGAARAGAGNLQWIKTGEDQSRLMCQWLRDLFGNPFRPVTVDVTWLTSNVTGLVQGIYDNREFDLMPILGDAVEEADCTNEEILKHCRTGSDHIRGCWVVDLLGKG
jgi:hypothetical protein